MGAEIGRTLGMTVRGARGSADSDNFRKSEFGPGRLTIETELEGNKNQGLLTGRRVGWSEGDRIVVIHIHACALVRRRSRRRNPLLAELAASRLCAAAFGCCEDNLACTSPGRSRMNTGDALQLCHGAAITRH